jgi:ATP-dependent DNA helicase RecQ
VPHRLTSGTPTPIPPRAEELASRCLSIDLEIGRKTDRIFQLAAVRGTGESMTHRGGDVEKALRRLDEFAQGAEFLLSHNLIAFDVPHLEAANPELRLLKLPRIDTLRLNPLAFPRNPYHYLVKHYQDGQLRRGRRNDPEMDARLTLAVLADQQRALSQTAPDLLTAWRWLVGCDGHGAGHESFLGSLGSAPSPTQSEAEDAIRGLLRDAACAEAQSWAIQHASQSGWPLAYALAWLSVAGGNSVMPPWVRFQFPESGELVRRLRDTPCVDAACGWCREHHDARMELKRWFGWDAYRAEPVADEGGSMQQAIVEAAMRGEHVLGILPTGAGKSVCYQIPALSRYEKTGALTVVISPLVALMADQVAGLQGRGIASCAAVNGLLSMPERADVLDRVRLGDIAILLVAPEQLRNLTVRRALEQREVGAWVLDEAHCLSKWGHAFRPDYRYVGRFIRQKAKDGPVPPILCLTATAKLDVIEDITRYFRNELGVTLRVFDGGTTRTNLEFAVVRTSPAAKWSDIHQLIEHHLPDGAPGGAIVYCATREGAENVARFLTVKEERAGYFHAGLPPETKKNVQERFIRGDLRVIASTNAFGMGIDKPDVRLVVHADVPGSLENYLQEAGRAGRDRRTAHCVLLYTPDDVERQFGMSARSRLTSREIQSILRALRRLDQRKRLDGVVVATTGEILTDEEEGTFARDSATDDTRVRTAVAWLEEALLLSREENVVNVFPSSLLVTSIDEARDKLEKRVPSPAYREQLLRLVEALIVADADEGVSTDELMGVSGLSTDRVRKALFDLADVGITRNDTALTAFVHYGVERSSTKRLARAAALEIALIDVLRESAPDLARGEGSVLHLRQASHRLKEAGHDDALPERLWTVLRGIAADGRSDDGGIGSLRLTRIDADTVRVVLQREWTAVAKTAELRRAAGERLLEHLLECLPAGLRGTDLLATTTLGQLRDALDKDMLLAAQLRDPVRALERALLWLHEQEVLRLNKGLAVFRSAMTIRLSPEKRGFGRTEFEPLKLHYDEQVVQIHVIAEYAELGLQSIADALRLTFDYFTLTREEFIQRWLPRSAEELKRQTTPASWRAIVESLHNPVQQRIVADKETESLLVLAGPGSGKTRVLVHRIAYLVRVLRENPKGILALAYNRHAAVEIRRRLAELIGDDAKGVMVRTCHALAMRLAGLSFAGDADTVDDDVLKSVIPQAVAVLKGTGLAADEADEQRDRLLGGFRHILVDEYQDIAADQYELISALAGRTLEDQERKLSLFAVGDDDQNIYAFAGASVEYIRRFKNDYASKPVFLTENYRSTQNIVAAANAVIESARERMKADHPIAVNRARAKAASGGEWQSRDPVGAGRVQVLPAGSSRASQAVTIMRELERLSKLASDWSWSRVAVIAREWRYLEPVRAYCELHGIPAQMANDAPPNVWRLRETQALLTWARAQKLLTASTVKQQLSAMSANEWVALLLEAADEYELETGGAELSKEHFIEWLAEWAREVRTRQVGVLLLVAHRAKGLEFDHVAVLDGGWDEVGRGEDPDASRRLYYVAMTRARQTLCLARLNAGNRMLDALPEIPAIQQRSEPAHPRPSPLLSRRYERLGLTDVDLGFAGRVEADAPVHRAIAALSAGSALGISFERERGVLLDPSGMVVSRLAASYAPPKGMTCVAARVAAIMSWTRAQSEPDYQSLCRCDAWEVVIPELVFQPV